jgi:DNA invertase Pin-like site-specific DNA recombinase
MSVYIYTRQSTDRQDNTRSVQEAECKAWASVQGYDVSALYHDEVSGSVDPVERESFSALLDQLQEGDVIICQKRDRLGRDVIANAVTQRLINRKGARLVTLDCLNSDTPEGALLSTLLDAMAQYERALISARTRKALADRKRRGLASGTPTLGSKIEGERVVTDQEEQEKIERVRSWRSTGLSLKAVHAHCEAEGVTTRKGTTPTLKTLSLWCRGVELSQQPKRSPRSAQTKARPRLDQQPQSRGLTPLIKALREQGLSFEKIAARVTEEGYTTSKGGAITKTQVIRAWKHNNLYSHSQL